jgi:two-component system alkaline phosphatase synthesis response regulator PhoP
MGHILIVDDEADIRELLRYNLEKEGHTTDEAENGEAALARISAIKPDLILIDVMMPVLDGIQTCEIIKENLSLQDILICFLTARAEDYSQIAGLEAGGDDYITKPIKPKVLVSRINALLRRKPNEVNKNEHIVANEDISIDKDSHLVYVQGVSLQLPRKEFDLLALLASKPNTVFKREYILTNVWGTEVIVGDRTIDVHIRKLREKIGDNYIQTIKGVGYKFCSPLK